MPLVRISLRKGRPLQHLRALTDGVHKALVDTYDIPVQDRLQIVEQCDPEKLLSDRDHLDVRRTDDIVLVHIVASQTRSTETKQALYKAITDHPANSPGVMREDVQIVLSLNGREDWSFGNGIASYLPAA